AQSFGQRPRHAVTMPVLVPDSAGDLGREALTGEVQDVGGGSSQGGRAYARPLASHVLRVTYCERSAKRLILAQRVPMGQPWRGVPFCIPRWYPSSAAPPSPAGGPTPASRGARGAQSPAPSVPR